MRYFPINLNLNQKHLIFAGGNIHASAKVRLALLTKAQITVIAAKLNADLEHHYKNDKIRWVKLDASPDNIAPYLKNCTIFYAATGDKELDTALSMIAKNHATLVNAVDQPHLSDFITPALIHRAPVTIAISTEGAAPVLARFLKAHIESLIPKTIGALAQFAGNLRPEIDKHLNNSNQKRKFWEWFFASNLLPQNNGLRHGLMRPIHIGKLVQKFQSTKDTHPAGGLYFLAPDNMLDEDALARLRHADSIYYHRANLRADLIEMARREADFFPEMLPDRNALKEAQNTGKIILVIAKRENLIQLTQLATNIMLPIYYLGKMQNLSLNIKSIDDFDVINWHAFKMGEITLPRKLFSHFKVILLKAGHPASSQLFVIADKKIHPCSLAALEQSPDNGTQILFDSLNAANHVRDLYVQNL